MHLTEEQRLIVQSRSRALKVVAFAGAGKTSTLRAYAASRPSMRFLYLAFNRAINEEAKRKFPANVHCLTTHSLAYKSIGHQYRGKLKSGLRANDVTKAFGLGAGRAALIHAGKAVRVMEHFIASPHQTFDEFQQLKEKEPSIDPDAILLGERIWKAMADLDNPTVPMVHDGYLKLYQQSRPSLNYDCILFDEAQDANSVTLEILRHQRCDRVFVGDPHQQIYGFRRAMNAMEDPSLTDELYLTQSFRFGDTIASVANAILALKRESRSVRGDRTRAPSRSRAFLARGNAAAYRKAAALAKIGEGVHFIGGIDGYRLDLLRDIAHLRIGNRADVRDPIVRQFAEFDHLVDYARAIDERDLTAWTKLVERHEKPSSIPNEIETVRTLSLPTPSEIAICVATAHKSKGLEFGEVEIADDFPKPEIIDIPAVDSHVATWQYGPLDCPTLWDGDRFKGCVIFPEEEINLRYVAATRAEGRLMLAAWDNPSLAEIQRYIHRKPDFILVRDVSVLRTDRRAGEAALSTASFSSADGSGGSHLWSRLDPSDASVTAALEHFNRRWPYLQWDWFASEARSRRGRGSVTDFITRICGSVVTPAAQAIVIDFLLRCGFLTMTQSVVSVRDGDPSYSRAVETFETLGHAIHRIRGLTPTMTGPVRFGTPGWFSRGFTDASCPKCSHERLDGYHKAYQGARGDLLHYWGLFCIGCRGLFEPSDLDLSERARLGRFRSGIGTHAEPRWIKPGELSIGDRVIHETFGAGTVTSIVGERASESVSVRLDSGATRWFKVSQARLTRGAMP